MRSARISAKARPTGPPPLTVTRRTGSDADLAVSVTRLAFAATVTAPASIASKVNRWCAISISSPGRSRSAVTLTPFTRVPLALPRSAITKPSASWRSSACTRETAGSEMTMSLSSPRPNVTGESPIGNRCPARSPWIPTTVAFTAPSPVRRSGRPLFPAGTVSPRPARLHAYDVSFPRQYPAADNALRTHYAVVNDHKITEPADVCQGHLGVGILRIMCGHGESRCRLIADEEWGDSQPQFVGEVPREQV